MRLGVAFRGENTQKMFLFANGAGQLVTDIFPTLDAAIERFGNRIETGGFKYSGPYKDGLNAAMNRLPYAPVRALGKQAVLEYGTGYIAGMLELGNAPVPVPVAPVAPEPPAVVEPEPVVVAPKKRGRPRKQEMELL